MRWTFGQTECFRFRFKLVCEDVAIHNITEQALVIIDSVMSDKQIPR